MIRIILIPLIFLLFSKVGISQETEIVDSLFQTPQEQFEFISENLDLSEITSGLIIDKAFKMIPIENYTGLVLADSNISNAMQFVQMYVTLRTSAISNFNKLPQP